VPGWLLVTAARAEPPEPAPLTKEQQDKLKEWEELFEEAKRLLSNNQAEEAIALAEKALVLTREVRGG
jgi:hypothetical protein